MHATLATRQLLAPAAAQRLEALSLSEIANMDPAYSVAWMAVNTVPPQLGETMLQWMQRVTAKAAREGTPGIHCDTAWDAMNGFALNWWPDEA